MHFTVRQQKWVYFT